MMNIEINTPIHPSILTFQIRNTPIEINVVTEIIESIRASVPDATKDSELYFLPRALVNKPKMILTTIADPTTTAVTQENSTSSGVIIFWIAS